MFNKIWMVFLINAMQSISQLNRKTTVVSVDKRIVTKANTLEEEGTKSQLAYENNGS
jgi:hypothetical protein